MTIQRATKEQMAVFDRLENLKRLCGVPVQRVEDTDEFKQADDKRKAFLVMRAQLHKPMRVGRG